MDDDVSAERIDCMFDILACVPPDSSIDKVFLWRELVSCFDGSVVVVALVILVSSLFLLPFCFFIARTAAATITAIDPAIIPATAPGESEERDFESSDDLTLVDVANTLSEILDSIVISLNSLECESSREILSRIDWGDVFHVMPIWTASSNDFVVTIISTRIQ